MMNIVSMLQEIYNEHISFIVSLWVQDTHNEYIFSFGRKKFYETLFCLLVAVVFAFPRLILISFSTLSIPST